MTNDIWNDETLVDNANEPIVKEKTPERQGPISMDLSPTSGNLSNYYKNKVDANGKGDKVFTKFKHSLATKSYRIRKENN